MATYEELNALKKYRDPATGEIRQANPMLNPQLFTPNTEISQDLTQGSSITSPSITSADLKIPLKLKLPTLSSLDYGQNLGSISTYLAPLPSSTETAQSDIQKRILRLAEETGQKGAFQAQEEQRQQVPEYTQQLRNLTTQINALDLQAQKIPIATEQEFAGRGTLSSVAPIERGRLRDNTIQRLGLAAQGLVLQGNLANAKDLVDRAVNLKFADKEQELKYLQTAYNMNKDTLEREDKKRSDTLQVQLQERMRILGIQKDNMASVHALVLAVTKNNPNDPVAQLAARDAMQLDPNDPQYLNNAFNLIGKYQANPLETKKDMLEQQIKEADVANLPLQKKKLEAEIGKINAEAAKARLNNQVLSVKDSENLNVPYGTTRGEAIQLGRVPNIFSASTKTMLEAAPQVVRFVDRIDKQVDDAENGLGPAASRWREFKAGKVGFADPAFTGLRTNVGLLTTLLLRMHVGARGGEYIMKHFQDLIDASKQSPENLKAALSEIKIYAEELNTERTQGINVKNAKEQQVIKLRNIKTGQIQSYNGALTPEEARKVGFEIIQ